MLSSWRDVNSILKQEGKQKIRLIDDNKSCILLVCVSFRGLSLANATFTFEVLILVDCDTLLLRLRAELFPVLKVWTELASEFSPNSITAIFFLPALSARSTSSLHLTVEGETLVEPRFFFISSYRRSILTLSTHKTLNDPGSMYFV